MTTPSEDLCEVCRERPGINFVCYGSTGKSIHFCDECFKASATAEGGQWVAAVREAHCEYCGGQPCTGGTDMFELVTGLQKSKYMCLPCSMEYHRYLEQQLSPDA